MSDAKEMTSFRLDAELAAGLRKRAEERGESVSDTLRDAVLLVLGYCPTCQRKVAPNPPAETEVTP